MKKFISNLAARLTAWVHKLLAEDNGNPSSLRLAFLAWHLAVGLVWTGLCIYRREMVHIDESVLALLSMATGAKVGQKFTEAKSPGVPAAIDTPPAA